MASTNKIDFFNDYWGFLESQGVPSMILHSWQEYPEHIASDVDYCVPQEHLSRVIPLLDSYCKKNGWSLCQIFQHEKTAYFCVCASNDKVCDLIMLDVCGDYTVRGVRHIPSEVFTENRQQHGQKKFWVLNAIAELTYVLTKAAAKRKNPDLVMRRVKVLLNGMDERCHSQVAGYLPLPKFLNSECLFGDPAGYLASSPWAKRVGESSGSSWFELVRKVKRVLQPTGYHVDVCSTNREDYHTVADLLVDALKDTCRNTLVIDFDNQSTVKKSWKDYLLAKIKSTLVVSCYVSNSGGAKMSRVVGADLKIDLPESFSKSSDIGAMVEGWALEVRQSMAGRTRRRWLNG